MKQPMWAFGDRLTRAMRGYALKLLDALHAEYLKRHLTHEIFAEIYRKNVWMDESSRSGAGSNLRQTASIRASLPSLFERYAIKTMLDIPCGDFYWMKEVDLADIAYTGADLVSEIIAENKRYEKPGIKFDVKNLISDQLPKVDLIFCRDCLVHLSNSDIKKALANIVRSGSGYLLTTTFTGREKNKDIPTGNWRALNLQCGPFNLPPPLLLINEDHPAAAYKDKAMALWKISDLEKTIK